MCDYSTKRTLCKIINPSSDERIARGDPYVIEVQKVFHCFKKNGTFCHPNSVENFRGPLSAEEVFDYATEIFAVILQSITEKVAELSNITEKHMQHLHLTQYWKNKEEEEKEIEIAAARSQKPK